MTIFKPLKMCGDVRVPASKSQAHRALICAALAGNSKITGLTPSQDITATLGALKALGADIEADFEKGTAVSGKPLVRCENDIDSSDYTVIDCGESASTLRFMIPIAAALGRNVEFIGHGRLPERTTMLYKPLLEAHGVRMDYPNDGKFLPLRQSGKLTDGIYEIRGDISSQFVTGLIYALSIVGEGSVRLTTKLESRPYADMTVDVMRRFGMNIADNDDSYVISGKYSPTSMDVEGDCSQAAFFAVPAAIHGSIRLFGIDQSTKQGDFKLFEILKSFGAKVEYSENIITVSEGKLKAYDIDASNIPDLVPALAVLAAYSEGHTRIYNAGRLRLKESDRIATTVDMINSLGGEAFATDDGMVITGKEELSGGKVKSYGDHRIAMAAAAASVGCEADIEVDDMSCTAKSFPNFTDLFEADRA